MNVLDLYLGVLGIKRENELEMQEIQRYARVSLILDAHQQGSSDILSLRRAPEFCRNKERFPIYLLGAMKSEGTSESRLRIVGASLCCVLAGLETPPSIGREQWESESFNGEGKPLVPVAIHGTDYFKRHGLLFAPENYRTNDALSKELLRRLTPQVQ